MKKILAIVLLLVLVLSLIPIGSVLADPPTRFEYYTYSDSSQNVYGVKWKAQSFTPQAGHNITEVRLKGYKQGSPGVLNVTIQETTGTPAVPDGTDLCSGTFDPSVLTTDGSGEWFTVNMSGARLEAGTQYAWVASSPTSDSVNRTWLRLDLYPDSTYPGGVQMASSNSGTTWFWGEPDGKEDFAFEEWGNWLDPSVTTDAITGFGNTWAVGRGTVTDMGSVPVTQIGIEYGLTDAYGSEKIESTYVSSGQTFSVRIDDLNPATQYHWRVKAYNGDGNWTYGGDVLFHTVGSDTLYEYWNTLDDADLDIYGNNWTGQTFATNATVPHTVTQVRVKLFRVGSPDTLTVNVYRTSAGVPTGQEIGTGDIDGDTFTTDTAGAWSTITLDEEVALETSTMYAITLSAIDGDSSNYVSWRYDNGNGYAGGTEVVSTDGGITWATVGANDMMFEIWGNPGLRILGCRVFESLIEANDQLFIYSYQVVPPSDFDDDLPINYFHTQLLVGSTLEAQAKLPAWGYRPGGFYLSVDEALPWGSNLTSIKIVGIAGEDFAGDEAEYILTATDWVGEDLNTLDDWIITTANAMGTWYGLTLTGVTSTGGYFLNPDGTVLFTIGIPGLEDIRPGIFSVQGYTEIPEGEEFDTSYSEGLVGGFGERWINATEEIGDLVGVSGELVGGTLWIYVIVLGLSVAGQAVNPAVGLVTAALPLAFIGGQLGTVPLEYILLPVFILGIFAVLRLTGLVR